MNKIILIILVSVIFFSCNHTTVVDTDEYSIELPNNASFFDQAPHSLIDDIDSSFAVIVFRKELGDYTDIQQCIQAEIKLLLEGKNSYNIVTQRTRIDNNNALISRGVNFLNGKKIFWLTAVIQTKYYYYIIRVITGERSFISNELLMEKIVYSFRLHSQY